MDKMPEIRPKRGLCGSLTVMMSLVLFIIVSLMLVTLEHAYLNAGKTLAFQTLNKALESALGNYYAPLYTQYGLFALPLGEGLSYEDISALEESMAAMAEVTFSGTEDVETDGFLWDMDIYGCVVMDEAYMTDINGDLFKEQVKDTTAYDLVLEISGELLSLEGEDISIIKDLLTDAKDSLMESGEEESNEEGSDQTNSVDKSEDSTEQADETSNKNEDSVQDVNNKSTESKETEEKESAEEDESGVVEVYETLKAFFTDGFSGWWFEDAGKLSEREVDVFELPSFEYYGDYEGTELFEEPDFSQLVFDDGEYLDELIDSSFVTDFQNALDNLLEKGSTKVSLAGYSVMNMDNYLTDNVDGELKYEQEYLIFGGGSDEYNVKKAGWSIFGIRLIANLIYFLTDEEMGEEVSSYVSGITGIAKWVTILMVIVEVVLAVENAIVETAAILAGKKVDFAVSKGSLSVGLSELFSFSKSLIMSKAENYTGVSNIKLSYEMYLFIFMLMLNEDLLTFRMIDIIEVNMKKLYDSDFFMEDCLVGFSTQMIFDIPTRFTSIGLYGGPGKEDEYEYRVQSVIMY